MGYGKTWICRPVRRYTGIPGLEFTERQRTGTVSYTHLDDFHCPVIGEGGYLVQDAADEQGTAITPALSLSLIHIFLQFAQVPDFGVQVFLCFRLTATA